MAVRTANDVAKGKLAWAADKPGWLDFYRKFFATDEGQAHLEWCAARSDP